MSDMVDALSKLLAGLDSMLDGSDIELTPEETDRLMSTVRVPTMIRHHFADLIENRKLILTGDADHMSVKYMLDSYANIDAPRKYDFQDEDVNAKNFKRDFDRFVPYIMDDITREQVEKAINGEEWLVLPSGFESSCYDCCERLFLKFKGNEAHLCGEVACKSNQKFTLEIDFPTGEVVFDDWPARFSEAQNAGYIVERGSHDINTLKGTRDTTDDYAAQQILFHFVGNTCPPLFVGDGTFRVGGRKKPNVTNAGHFCTDLWWTTMIDRKFYDMIVGKLPKDRDTRYYEKDLHIAHIKPGRYRITCYSRGEDDNMTFLSAKRIGDASDFVPMYDIRTEKRLMSLDEAIGLKSRQYPSLYATGTYEDSKFAILDYTFNRLSGSIGDFYSDFSTNQDSIPHGTFTGTPNRNKPYPNFSPDYCLLHKMGKDGIAELPTDWLEGIVWYYMECYKYFENGAEGYYHAYPSKEKDDLREIVESLKEGRTHDEWCAYITKTYGWAKNTQVFNGDYEDWRTRCWNQEKIEIMSFIHGIICTVNTVIAERKE